MLNRIFFFCGLLAVVLLNGCAVLNSNEGSSSAGLYDDDKARSSIIAALHDKDPQQASGIAVLCFNSHAFLLGHADVDFQRFATATARKTAGVSDVTAHWFDSGSVNRMQDAAIAANIDSAIFLDKSLSSTRMAVEVFDGHVILCGSMRSRENIDRVIEIARGVENVKSVTSYLVY